jgi:hypothetical protein
LSIAQSLPESLLCRRRLAAHVAGTGLKDLVDAVRSSHVECSRRLPLTRALSPLSTRGRGDQGESPSDPGSAVHRISPSLSWSGRGASRAATSGIPSL